MPHNLSLFTRERIASKIRDIRKRYKKAADSGKKSGGGGAAATFYDVCNEIWGGCPATTSLERGVDTADSEVLDVTEGDPRSVNSASAAHVPDLNTSVGEGSSEVESITRLRFHTVHAVRLLIRKTKVMP